MKLDNCFDVDVVKSNFKAKEITNQHANNTQYKNIIHWNTNKIKSDGKIIQL